MDRKIITQIGSLPYDNVKDALGYSLKHDVPFLPELPKLGDSMLDYIKNPGRLSCLDEFKRNDFEVAKVQCVGPATLILSGYDENEAVGRCYEHVSKILEGLISDSTILFLDEPALGQVGFDYKSLWEQIFESFDVVSGVHVCGNMDWSQLFNSKVDIISFDASLYDLTVYPEYRGEKKIAWGVASRRDVRDFRDGDFLTLSCGMSPTVYGASDCDKSLEKLVKISESL